LEHLPRVQVCGVDAQHSSRHLIRLEAAGLAIRVPDATSRRQILVKPSRHASRRVYRVFGGLIEKGDKFRDPYSQTRRRSPMQKRQ
jgi:hypothetical protein